MVALVRVGRRTVHVELARLDLVRDAHGRAIALRIEHRGKTELVIVVTPYLVKPVDANDIKLPTDGFRAPTMFQQLLSNTETDGVTGGDRPKPSAVGEGAKAPKIGMDDQGTAPALSASDDKDRRKGKKADQTADAIATPGFSLK